MEKMPSTVDVVCMFRYWSVFILNISVRCVHLIVCKYSDGISACAVSCPMIGNTDAITAAAVRH